MRPGLDKQKDGHQALSLYNEGTGLCFFVTFLENAFECLKDSTAEETNGMHSRDASNSSLLPYYPRSILGLPSFHSSPANQARRGFPTLSTSTICILHVQYHPAYIHNTPFIIHLIEYHFSNLTPFAYILYFSLNPGSITSTTSHINSSFTYISTKRDRE